MTSADVQDLLRKAIEQSGETQNELSRKTGIAQSAISMFVNGKRTYGFPPTWKLMQYFGFKVTAPDGKEVM